MHFKFEPALPKDAVLVCCIGSLGKTGIAGQPLATNQQINAVIFDEKRLCPRYGFHACRRLKQRLEAMAPATTLAIVSKSKFSALEIPVPPMHMQQRIAAILDQADSLRRLRQRAIERLNSLGQAIFSEMFGDLKSNSKSFRMQLLSDLIYVRGGFAFPSSDFGEVGHPVVRISNIDGETVWIDGSARIEENRLGKGKTFGVNEGDILIAMSGATTGKIGVMPSYAGPVYLNQRVGRYEIKLKDRIDPSYLRLLVKSDFYQSKILEQAWGAAQPNVSGAQLASFEVPIPPMEMQEVFANRLRTLELCKTASSNALQRAKILFRSLQHRAFHGEL